MYLALPLPLPPLLREAMASARQQTGKQNGGLQQQRQDALGSRGPLKSDMYRILVELVPVVVASTSTTCTYPREMNNVGIPSASSLCCVY